MFRTMRRFKQELTREECLAVLRSQPRGVLSLLGENGYPYGLPIDYWYNETDGKLYFHGAKEGHKIDAIRACDKASFCVHDEGHPAAGCPAWQSRRRRTGRPRWQTGRQPECQRILKPYIHTKTAAAI